MNLNWGNNLTEDDQGLSDYPSEEELSNPEALNFGNNMTQTKGKKTKTRGRKGNPQLKQDNSLKERQNYQKLDKGDRGYR